MKDYKIVITYQNPDGSIRTTYLNEKDRLVGESDSVFSERIKQKHGISTPALLTLPSKLIQFSDLPDVSKKRSWRSNPQGKIIVDNSVEIPEDSQKRKRDSIKSKLKSNGLSQEEVDYLVK